MTEIVNMHEAKSTLSRLVERAMAGEEIILARAGKPLVRLVPVVRRREPRQPGKWRDQVWMADDFDRLPEDLLDAFEGKTS
jgi:prevent-host-death family protein